MSRRKRTGVCYSAAMGGATVLVVWFLLSFAGAAATAWSSQRLWKRRKQVPSSTRIIAILALVTAMIGALGTAVGLLKALGAAGGESVDPSQKARIIAEGISEAMNCTALGLAVWVPSAVALFWVNRRQRERS